MTRDMTALAAALIAATLHAREVGPLPESGKATPMSSLLASGGQFAAIAAGDHVIAFRLRR
jgi:glucose dehydrogenase